MKGPGFVQLGRIVLFTSVSIFVMVSYLVLRQPIYVEELRLVPIQINAYFVDTVGCKIPRLDPFHPLVRHLQKPAKPMDCSSSKAPLVIQGSGPFLVLLRQNMRTYGDNVSCTFQAVYRENEFKSVLNDTVHKLDHDIVPMTDEFVMVNCYNIVYRKATKVFDDFFAFIVPKHETEKRVRETRESLQFQPDEQMSVLLLAIDSVAKSHFHRMMVKTEKYLRQKVAMIEMFGYNKIGKNTFPVMLPFLTGYAEGEVNHTSDRPVDFLPFVWKDYIKAGYRTLLSEDNANTAIFDYVRKGFQSQPTDYYWRTMKLATQTKDLTSASKFGCIKTRSEADTILKWTLDFFDAFPDEPLFALTLLSHFTHDSIQTLSRYDEPYMKFIQQMNERNHLNSTIVIFFSDHGFRYGETRQSYLGRMEGKLPFLFLLVPTWFQEKYPHMASNLRENANRLISVLDLHTVLKDLANFTVSGDPKAVEPNRGHSINIFRTVVSDKRTCQEAKIPLQYCACTSRQQISTESPEAAKAAKMILYKINEYTRSFRGSCAELRLNKINNAASQIVPMDDNGDNKSSIYQVVIQVTPGDGVFEGSVWHLDEGNKFTADPNIERVNRYGNQSDCILDRAVKPFCFCS